MSRKETCAEAYENTCLRYFLLYTHVSSCARGVLSVLIPHFLLWLYVYGRTFSSAFFFLISHSYFSSP